ncbi:hypothetical protein EIP91_007157 [Steccherinum ochraceum]|uniref:Uncharacterized protein n=1 Tax=Steccherinum ochraceum TaxID=92696 RepID=A0A4R0S0U4_9APHY|nr:hypothetical protein EIP91_007157 [Steccherinum ochraceum]
MSTCVLSSASLHGSRSPLRRPAACLLLAESDAQDPDLTNETSEAPSSECFFQIVASVNDPPASSSTVLRASKQANIHQRRVGTHMPRISELLTLVIVDSLKAKRAIFATLWTFVSGTHRLLCQAFAVRRHRSIRNEDTIAALRFPEQQ